MKLLGKIVVDAKKWEATLEKVKEIEVLESYLDHEKATTKRLKNELALKSHKMELILEAAEEIKAQALSIDYIMSLKGPKND